ncbi:receptor-transporting protein 3-like [Mantella aurantiaca]
MNRDVWREIFETDLEDRGVYDVWDFYLEQHFQARNGWLQYSLCGFARFCCSICDRSWASSKVKIFSHMKFKGQTGQVRMYVFKQKCKMCSAAEYEEPIFEVENIEIAISYLVNSIMQRFYNQPIDDFPRSFVTDVRQNGPHDYNNCEGCALGICQCETDIHYYDKRPILPKGNNQRSNPKKKFLHSNAYPYHQVASQSQRSTFLDIEATGNEGSSDFSDNILFDEQREPSECCCIIL